MKFYLPFALMLLSAATPAAENSAADDDKLTVKVPAQTIRLSPPADSDNGKFKIAGTEARNNGQKMLLITYLGANDVKIKTGEDKTSSEKSAVNVDIITGKIRPGCAGALFVFPTKGKAADFGVEFRTWKSAAGE